MKSVIIDNIHYINFTTFNICTLFFLIYPAEIIRIWLKKKKKKKERI